MGKAGRQVGAGGEEEVASQPPPSKVGCGEGSFVGKARSRRGRGPTWGRNTQEKEGGVGVGGGGVGEGGQGWCWAWGHGGRGTPIHLSA